MSDRKRNGLALIIFTVIATVLLNRALLPDYALLSLDLIPRIAPWEQAYPPKLANPLLSDPLYSFYPRRYLLTQAVREGQLPLWNPYVLTGTPEVANPNFQLFYPPNLIAAEFLPPYWALAWLAWWHLILTGALMYIFLRRQGLTWWACVLGGGAWMLNGYGLVWLENPHRLSTAAWLPGIFWAFEAAVQDRKIKWAALGGLFLGLSILGGQMQFIFGIGLMLGVYGLAKMIGYSYQTRKVPYQSIVYLATIGVIGLGIGSPVLLPAGEFAAISQRTQSTADTIQNSAWPIDHLVTLATPDFYGNPSSSVDYWGTSNYAETAAYFGVVCLLLALTAPFVARQRPALIQSLVQMIVILMLTLGTPLAQIVFLFPGAQFLALGRLNFLIPFAGVWLAAVGADGWLQTGPISRRQRAAIGIACVVMAIMVISAIATLGDKFAAHQSSITTDLLRSGVMIAITIVGLIVLHRRLAILGAVLIILVVGDLLQWGWSFNPIISIDLLFPANPVTQKLHADTGLYRVMPIQSGKMIFGPNVLSLFNLQEMGGYTPLIKQTYHDLFWSIDDDVKLSYVRGGGNMLITSDFHPIYSLFNVKYVLAPRDLPYTIVPQASQTTCDQIVSIKDKVIKQPFTTTADGLNRVDVYIARVNGKAGEAVHFTVHRKIDQDEVVVDASVPIEEIQADSTYSFFFAPIVDSRSQNFVWSIDTSADMSVCRAKDGTYDYSAYATWLQLVDVLNSVRIYENPNAMPRAFMVHRLEQVSSDQAVNRLLATDFDWRHSAVLTSDLPSDQQAQLAAPSQRSDDQVTVTDYQLNQVSINVQANSSGLLVLSDSYYPDWLATLDGQPAPIYETDAVFRGVFVPVGSHHIHFQFDPPALKIGLGLATISLLVAFSLIAASLRRRNQA